MQTEEYDKSITHLIERDFMYPKLSEAAQHLEAASAALLEVVATSDNEPLLALSTLPIVEVLGALATRIRLLDEATGGHTHKEKLHS